MEKLFAGSLHLEYINIKNFKENDSLNYDSIFKYIPDNVVICINESNINLLNELQTSTQCYIIDCSNNWKIKQKKLININETNNICLNNCSEDILYKYEYNGKCYENCSQGFLINDKICKCELDKCLTCSPVSLYKNLCDECNINYYQKENDELNIGKYINCYKELDGYYLDLNNSIFKKCYETCQTC